MIESVDIGGAASMGVPVIPEARNADFDSEDELGLLAVPGPKQIPDLVKNAIAPGAQVAYPELHPATDADLQQDSKGRIIVPKGKLLSKSTATVPRQITNVAVTDLAREESSRKLDELLADEAPVDEPLIARSAEGIPVIEVVFHTSIGAIVSYFNKVVNQGGQWLILVSDNRAPAAAKFFPQPSVDHDGNQVVFEMTITGADKRPNNVKAIPLGMQFTVDQYDFIVMMLAEPEA